MISDEKLRKLERLAMLGATIGERAAAARALNRLRPTPQRQPFDWVPVGWGVLMLTILWMAAWGDK